MRILIAPDSFKGSLSAKEFCRITQNTIENHWPNDEVFTLPLADGGEGTVESLVEGTDGKLITLEVTGPLGRPVKAQYGILLDETVAVIEMASASGLPLVPPDKRDPMHATTYGTGELIADAINKGCRQIIIGIGGSATNDAGIGMMQALGFQCLDADNKEVPFGGEGLLKLTRIIPPTTIDFKTIDIQVACDVNNPLYGKNGAAHIYAGQKGANEDMITRLDHGLMAFATVVSDSLKVDVSSLVGGGAAGGLGAGLSAALGAKLRPGFEIIRRLVGLDAVLENEVDLVITGEGQLNHQSLKGKLPVELAKLAQSKGIPTIAFVGSRDISKDVLKDTGLMGVFTIVNGPMTLEDAMANSKDLLEEAVMHTLSLIHGMDPS